MPGCCALCEGEIYEGGRLRTPLTAQKCRQKRDLGIRRWLASPDLTPLLRLHANHNWLNLIGSLVLHARVTYFPYSPIT
jgi:hypothetical protein